MRKILKSTLVTIALAFSLTPVTVGNAAPAADGPATTAQAAAKPGLKKNRLYKANRVRPGNCAAQSTVPLDSDANLKAYYGSVLRCLNSSWSKLDGKAYKYKPAKLVVHYGNQVSKRCGARALSYYCPPDNTIYMYGNEIINPWLQWQGNDIAHRNIKLSALHTIAHEYGHHVQNLSKMFKPFGNKYGTLMENRLELQASCLAEVWMGANAATYPVTAEDFANGQYWRYIVVPNHGSAANQQAWGDRGYTVQKPGACNTWKAPKSSIL